MKRFRIVAGVISVIAIIGSCGCRRETPASAPTPSAAWSPFESARRAPPPSKAAIQAIATGTAAERVYQLIGSPDFWGHLETNFPGGYSLNTSYMTTGRMGPLPTTSHTYMMMGHPHSSLCWVYDLRGEMAYLQFTNYRLAHLSFGPLALMFDP